MKQSDFITHSFNRKVEGVEIELDGPDRFIVYTPFQFDDGDHYVIVLRKSGDGWLLTDEGHTFMHLSYDEVDGARSQMIDQVVAAHGVENDRGELRLKVSGDAYGEALFLFVQAITACERWANGKSVMPVSPVEINRPS